MEVMKEPSDRITFELTKLLEGIRMEFIKKMNAFDYNNMPTEEMKIAMVNVRARYKVLVDMIEKHCPESRERSLAITRLEESAMWANKAITHTGSPASSVEE